MDVLKQLDLDFQRALKERNELAVLTLRQLKAVLTNAEIVKNRQKLTTEDIIKVLRSEIKKRKEAIDLYHQGNRPQLAAKEQKEIEIINRYLPAQIDQAVIRQKIGAVITSLGPVDLKDSGRIIGLVMKELAGQADGSLVSQLVKEELTKSAVN
jgi:uncharacterized protein YqeY